MRQKTQADLVQEELASIEPVDRTDKLVLPGIETLHLKPTIEIAEVLANVLRSRPNITRMDFIIGSHIELTTRSS